MFVTSKCKVLLLKVSEFITVNTVSYENQGNLEHSMCLYHLDENI